MHEFPKPTIAMIRGYCIGGGLGLAVCCDLRICSDNSRFAVPAAKLGLGYGYAGLKRLVDVVGPAFAKEIFFTARQFDAEEARAMGLVNRVVPEAELETYVKNYAETIAGNAPLTVKAVKYIVGEVMKDESKRDLARCAEMVDAMLRQQRLSSRAAGPSWRSASRCSPGSDPGFLGAGSKENSEAASCHGCRAPVWCFNSHKTKRREHRPDSEEEIAWRRLNCGGSPSATAIWRWSTTCR